MKLLSEFGRLFSQGRTSTMAASLAYYSALSLAPLVVLFVSIASQLSPALEQSFVTQTGELVGSQASRVIQMVVQNAKDRPQLASVSGLIGMVTLLISASLVFGELQQSLDLIFKSETPPVEPTDQPWWQSILVFLKERIFSMGFALSFIFLIIVSLLMSSVLAATLPAGQNILFRWLNVLISAGIYAILFSLMYRTLPHPRRSWHEARIGGVITAIFFVIGKEIIGIYLGQSALESSYGAAGSLLALLVWVYYSALITFMGAEASVVIMAAQDRSRQQKPG